MCTRQVAAKSNRVSVEHHVAKYKSLILSLQAHGCNGTCMLVCMLDTGIGIDPFIK